MNTKELIMIHPITLAFVGDAVQTLYVRQHLVSQGNQKAHALHIQASKIVSAVSQSKAWDKLEPTLTPEEKEIALRARNTAYHSKAKNATHEEYHKATMLEAVIGFNHLLGNETRTHQLCEMALAFGE